MMILNGEVSTSKEDKPMNDFNASEDYSTIRPAYVAGLERRVEQLEAALTRLTDAASAFVAMRSGKRRRELREAIAEARAALAEGRRLTER